MSPEQYDDALAVRMMATARIEVRRAAQRDGIFPAGLPQAKRLGASGPQVSPAGRKARKLFAMDPTLTPAQLASMTGISTSTARGIVREAKGNRRPGPKQGFKQALSPAAQAAVQMLGEGRPQAAVMAATGLSRSQVYRVKVAMSEQKAAA